MVTPTTALRSQAERTIEACIAFYISFYSFCFFVLRLLSSICHNVCLSTHKLTQSLLYLSKCLPFSLSPVCQQHWLHRFMTTNWKLTTTRVKSYVTFMRHHNSHTPNEEEKKKKNKIIILELHWVRCWPALASLACNHRIYAITFSMILPHSHNAGGTRAHMHVSMLLEPYIWWWCHCIDCTRITTMPQRVFTHVRASTDANKRNSRYFYKKKNARRGNK